MWAKSLELSSDDIALEENRLLRRFIIEGLVVPEEEDHIPSQDPMFSPELDLGLVAAIPIDEWMRPLGGVEYRRRLVVEGKRPRTMDERLLKKGISELEDVFRAIQDPNGISAGTFEELEAWLGLRFAPEEICSMVDVLLEQRVVEPIAAADDFVAVRLLEATTRR